MIDTPALVPEIDVTDFAASVTIYRTVFGFRVMAERPEEAFANLALGAAHLMLQQSNGPGRRFRTAPLERPHGRGVNFQLRMAGVTGCHDRSRGAGLAIVVPLEDRWYRQGDIERGNRRFVVADPDGYLLRFYEDIGVRPAR
ncbi:MAG: VOC family protein [Sphingomonas adhaesiva]|uniref:VOC family protein n=1 Tax=Sphingomonas adhaesiva TaxID=28212 RepID=UPI002FF76B97